MRARNEIIKETTKFLVSKLPIEEQTKIINFYLGNEPHDKSTLFNDVIEIEEEGKARKTAEENIALILKNQEIYHKLFDEVKDTLNSIKKVNYLISNEIPKHSVKSNLIKDLEMKKKYDELLKNYNKLLEKLTKIEYESVTDKDPIYHETKRNILNDAEYNIQNMAYKLSSASIDCRKKDLISDRDHLINQLISIRLEHDCTLFDKGHSYRLPSTKTSIDNFLKTAKDLKDSYVDDITQLENKLGMQSLRYITTDLLQRFRRTKNPNRNAISLQELTPLLSNYLDLELEFEVVLKLFKVAGFELQELPLGTIANISKCSTDFLSITEDKVINENINLSELDLMFESELTPIDDVDDDDDFCW